MEKKIGVVGIIVKDRQTVAELNTLLSNNNELIVGRMGIPHHGDINVISLIVEGEPAALENFSAQLKALPNVIVSEALSDAE